MKNLFACLVPSAAKGGKEIANCEFAGRFTPLCLGGSLTWLKALFIVCVRPNLLKYAAKISFNQKMTQLSCSPYMVESILENYYYECI